MPGLTNINLLDIVNDNINNIGMKTSEDAAGPESPGHTGSESHLLRELYRTNQAMFNNVPRIAGISASRLALVRLLAIDLPDGAGTMEIARRLGVNAAAVTRLVSEMEGRKWIKRNADPSDARRSRISLTARAVQEFGIIHERLHEFERSLNAVLDEKDIETTIRTLSEIRNALEKAK